MMKKTFRILGKLIGLIIILLFTILIGEWVYSEIRFQVWLSQDESRLDFSSYDTTEELKEALLTKLPIGSSVTEVQAFRIAHGFSYREPSKSYGGSFGVGMTKSKHSNRGFFSLRLFLPGVWGIYFELDPINHTLVDIHVSLQPGP